ncbi:hypothetical protein SAMN05660484_01559 [Eubacterium ruminantium]|uniref:Uncharacterized protein n=2 Tax=Eubacterium ruminantium TaxID=42322 RepID=A0A1T4NF32_9FIRM|nr:hypothetical protein [Eubacterium ruminantium]SCW53306.1 hypothetical protein SAMN05660484_01559 [Eubacterium ruminantium]SDM86455.1 hypothetical protein SAMN04490370_10734 [Eubacterium ruminantium]SJZ77723.1 hypothetical protein SAMN02745110_01559 [Eubacterium ruminantium]
MVDNEKVRIMTKIAIYEKNQEHEGLALSKYFREDYVRFNMLKTLVTSTICFWLFVAVSAVVNFEKYLQKFNSVDYVKLVGKLMGKYCLFLALFEVVAFFAYSYRYNKAKPGLVEYNGNLRRLIEYYEKLETTDKTKYRVSDGIDKSLDDFVMQTFGQSKGEADHGRTGQDKE